MVNSHHRVGPPREQPPAEPRRICAQQDRQQQIDRRRDDVGLEGAEVARLDEVGGVGQLLGRDLRHTAEPSITITIWDDSAGQILLQRRQQHHVAEHLEPAHREADAGFDLARGVASMPARMISAA